MYNIRVAIQISSATVSYNRLVVLEKKVCIPLAIFIETISLGKCTGISFTDSTPLRACHIKREKQNKVFKGTARKGQCSIGWFYGFKLHLIINDRGEILDFILTPGNTDNREPLKSMDFHNRIFGKLFVGRVHIVTKIKKNMKNSLMLMHDKIMLKKPAITESVNDQLKNICRVEHTGHRNFDNFIINMLSAIAAYSFFDKKPSVNTRFDVVDIDRLLIP